MLDQISVHINMYSSGDSELLEGFDLSDITSIQGVVIGKMVVPLGWYPLKWDMIYPINTYYIYIYKVKL